jgi:hypothetical protein
MSRLVHSRLFGLSFLLAGFCAHGKGYAVFVLRHPERRGTVEEASQLGQPSEEILGGKAATTDFAGDVLEELCLLIRAFFFLKLLPFLCQRHSLVDVGPGR